MAIPDRFIDKFSVPGRKSKFNPRARLRLTYQRKEPDGWPLKRPATPAEWAHVVKVMIMRRVPKSGPIHRTKLVRYVSGDLLAASDADRIYVDANFMSMRNVRLLVDRMCGGDKTLRVAPRIEDPEMDSPDRAIYRSEYADGWLKRVPVTVSAVVDFLPVTSVLDMMVQALIDDDEAEETTRPPDDQGS